MQSDELPCRLHIGPHPRLDEKTIQLSIRNFDYAEYLAKLLSFDGDRRVYLVEQPNSRLEGVVVMDEWGFVNLDISDIALGRIVLIVPKKSTRLSRTWDSAIPHVVFDDASPEAVKSLIISAEARLQARG